VLLIDGEKQTGSLDGSVMMSLKYLHSKCFYTASISHIIIFCFKSTSAHSIPLT